MIKSIGITGSIASGKSSIVRFLEILEFPVFNADLAGRELLQSPQIIKQITVHFGLEVMNGKNIDRKKLANIVFQDEKKLKTLNSIIHPAVIESFLKWKSNQKSTLVFHESAIIFEHQLEYLFDKIICVYAPEELCLQRAMKRDQASIEEINNRLKNQLNPEEKCKRADFTILNDEKTAIIPQVLSIVEKIQNS
ncbi:MAG: dephospho-CoA kinase [Bacteroidales bacterium]|nr:dephospho-CoA kinase [Bacteroidales bacterium]